jgi:hypothetical protein
VVAQHDANAPPRQQPRQALLAVAQRHDAEVLTIQLQEIEGVEHRLGDGAVPGERMVASSVTPKC